MPVGPAGVPVRVGQESVYKLTQKVRVDRADPADLSLTNTYLSAEEHALLCELPNRLVTKMRSVCPSETHDVVLDEFHGHLDGLRLAEVEVRDLGEHVSLPAWRGAEVTHDDRFSGGRLAMATGLEVRDVLRWVSGRQEHGEPAAAAPLARRPGRRDRARD